LNGQRYVFLNNGNNGGCYFFLFKRIHSDLFTFFVFIGFVITENKIISLILAIVLVRTIWLKNNLYKTNSHGF